MRSFPVRFAPTEPSRGICRDTLPSCDILGSARRAQGSSACPWLRETEAFGKRPGFFGSLAPPIRASTRPTLGNSKSPPCVPLAWTLFLGFR